MEQKLKPIHLACGDDEMRPNMLLVKIDDNVAMATNGHMLVKINLLENSQLSPEDLQILNGKCIHKEIWKEIHKCDVLEIQEQQIDCFKNGVKKTFYYSEPNGEFFNINSIVDEVRKAGEEKKRLMSYNACFIQILHKIFQTETLNFSFSQGERGTVVFPSETGMFAILMPVYTEGINRYIF